MKEFILNLKVFEKGLSPIAVGGPEYLERCVGMRFTEHGLEPFDLSENEPLKAADGTVLTLESLYNLYNIDMQNLDTTFLQLEDSVYLVSKDRLYDVTTGRLNEIAMYDVNFRTQESTFLLGNRWSIADTEDYRLFTNGRSIIYYDKVREKYFIDKSKSVNTTVFYEGRTLLGGFTDVYFYNSVWRDFYKSKGARNIPEFDESTVYWSSVGGMDIGWYFFPTRIFNETYDYEENYQMFLDLLHRESFGSMRIPEIGSILYMKQLGRYLVIYGSNGIALTTFIVDPVQSLSIVKIVHAKILNANCIAGSIDKHMYMDSTGALWLISESSMKFLDYRYLFDINSYQYKIDYHNLLDEFYITSNLKTYVFNRGMTEMQNSIIANAVIQNKSIYLTKEISYE